MVCIVSLLLQNELGCAILVYMNRGLASVLNGTTEIFLILVPFVEVIMKNKMKVLLGSVLVSVFAINPVQARDFRSADVHPRCLA